VRPEQRLACSLSSHRIAVHRTRGGGGHGPCQPLQRHVDVAVAQQNTRPDLLPLLPRQTTNDKRGAGARGGGVRDAKGLGRA